MNILHVAGARPNFMKIAPVIRQLGAHPEHFNQTLVHTGQHYDKNMSDVFWTDLGLPLPDIHLGIGSGSHAEQTGKVMIEFEKVLLDIQPDWVVVVGDVNSTVACSLTAAKLHTNIAHVEAGLRSFDRSMPEEINRVITDQLSTLLFTTEASANKNLQKEGIPEDRIHFVGNVMIDTLVRLLPTARERPVIRDQKLEPPYALVTLHRPANVDSPERLAEIMAALEQLSDSMTVVFPVHPRTRKNLDQHGKAKTLKLIEPVGYLDFLCLMASAQIVITDSGGIQEETTYLGVPCLTVRPNTERPVTISHGTNRLVSAHTNSILRAAKDVLNGNWTAPQAPPELWDGAAAERICKVFLDRDRG